MRSLHLLRSLLAVLSVVVVFVSVMVLRPVIGVVLLGLAALQLSF